MAQQEIQQGGGEMLVSVETLKEMMRTLVTEMRRPDPETEARVAAEKARAEASKKEMQAVVMLDFAVKQCLWGVCEHKDKRLRDRGGECYAVACQHKKPDGRASIGGQVNSDGLIHPICLRCQFEFPPYPPSGDSLAQGLGNVS